MSRCGASVLLVLTMACGSISTPLPPGPIAGPPPFQQDNSTPSLFPGDAAVLSDSAVRRILAYELVLPRRARVAVLELGARWGYQRWWSEETAHMNSHVTDTLLFTLEKSARVSVAAVLPVLLVPEKRTVPYLREAAARFQADLLLVYQPICGVFERSRFLAANQFRVTCTVEAVALDTRSGVVPFAGIRTRSLVLQRASEDFNQRDMLARGQFQGVAEAIAAVGEDLVGTLANVPML